uniref:Metalloendopeptidase n=1 Tax=Ditylenchus dipsaci TaxID=166011 RepID=A0A915CQC4_9BILA
MWRGCTTNSAAPLFGHFYSRVAWIIFVFVNTLVLHTGHSMNDENSSAAADSHDNYEANDYRNLLTSETIKQNMFSEAGLKNMSAAANKQQILAEYMQTSRSKRAVVGADAKIWNVYQHGDKFVVPYTIVSNYTDNQIKKIEKAMEEIESKTCILFQHINDKDTVEFYKGRSYAEISNSPNDGCHSVIGRSETINAVKLEVRAAEQKTCIVHHIVLHELLHLLGLYHEHQRPDRDKFMTIAREHVEDGRFYNFDKKMDARTLSDLIETNGTDIDDHPNKHKLKGVDEQSIMMYKADTFSKKDGLAVIKMHAKKWQILLP